MLKNVSLKESDVAEMQAKKKKKDHETQLLSLGSRRKAS